MSGTIISGGQNIVWEGGAPIQGTVVSDVVVENGIVQVFAPHTEFYKAKTALSDWNSELNFEVEEITFEPQTTSELSGDDIALFDKFLTMLNDCDDELIEKIIEHSDKERRDKAKNNQGSNQLTKNDIFKEV